MPIRPFDFRAQQPMTTSWQGRLQEAASEADVIMVAKDYVARFTPEEIELLPEPCRPGKFFEANDVTSYAFALVRHDCGDDREAAKLVHDLAAFFSNASTRLSQLMARPNSYAETDTRQSA
jgi:hypothetical protein